MLQTWNWVEFAQISSQKIIYIHICVVGYESNKGLALTYNFTACPMIKAKQMENVAKFDFMPESYMTRSWILTEYNF